VSRILKALGWTPQVPITRAIQRDERAVRTWRSQTWPRLQARARQEGRSLVFVDESGFYLLPGLVRTYAPETRTPVLLEKLTRDHLSVMGGMTPEGKVYTLARQESLNGLHSIEFLGHLRDLQRRHPFDSKPHVVFVDRENRLKPGPHVRRLLAKREVLR